MYVCRLNDIIVSVNGVTTVDVTHAGAVEALKRAGYTVDMVSQSIYSSELVIIIDIYLYVTNHLSGPGTANNLVFFCLFGQ